MQDWELGNWCAPQLHVKNWAGSSPFLTFWRGRFGLRDHPSCPQDTQLGTQAAAGRNPFGVGPCSSCLYCYFGPVFAAQHSGSLPTPAAWMVSSLFSGLELAHMPSFSSRAFLTQQLRPFQGHLTPILPLSPAILLYLLLLYSKHRVWISYSLLFPPCPSCQQCMFSYSWCAHHIF